MNAARNFSLADKKTAVEIVDYLLESAFKLNASDIHIDPYGSQARLRFRIDGVLHELSSIPSNSYLEIVSRIKILSGLRIDEHFSPQDGRFRKDFLDNKFADVRVSILPTYYGENVTLRLLSDKSESFSLDSLGFSEDDVLKIKKAAEKPSGMILATGPTGSGKTTTLYSILKILNKPDTCIVTIEEPVEYAIEGIRQVQVNPKSGLNFATGLRSILRQDPNIIMVGEIRDKETASLSVNTALTGHLLLSTLHTNDASSTLPRLTDLGVEPFLLASTFNIAINQRLVRQICSHCKKEEKINESQKERIKESTSLEEFPGLERLSFGTGCEKCAGSGYSGREVLGEVLFDCEEIRKAISEKNSARDIRNIAIKNGMKPMIFNGLEKVKKGKTTLEEVLRVVHE